MGRFGVNKIVENVKTYSFINKKKCFYGYNKLSLVLLFKYEFSETKKVFMAVTSVVSLK